MEINLPVAAYYDPSFVDPLWSPYIGMGNNGLFVPRGTEAKNGVIHDTLRTIGAAHMCTTASRRQLGNKSLMRPELVRQGKGHTFQRKHASYPCPVGYTPAADGYCVEAKREFEPLFYTEKMYRKFDRPGTRNITTTQYHARHVDRPHNISHTRLWENPNQLSSTRNPYTPSTVKSSQYQNQHFKDSYLA